MSPDLSSSPFPPPLGILWGDQHPERWVLMADVATLLTMAVATTTNRFTVALGSAAIAIASSRNLTNRWPITFPMLPWLMLQVLAGFAVDPNHWTATAVYVLSIFLVAIAAILSVLFPVMKLPPVTTAKYRVGIADVFLPIDIDAIQNLRGDASRVSKEKPSHAFVRVWYPIDDEQHQTTSRIPYLRPDSAKEFCEELMLTGAPFEAARKLAFFFHTFRLSSVVATKNASLISSSTLSKLPIIFYSHGLAGNSSMYSYQTYSMAANGYVVVSVEQTDGSAVVVPLKEGGVMRMDHEISKKKYVEHAQLRRKNTEYRTNEFLGALETFLSLNEQNLPELEEIGLDFRHRLDLNDVTFMGHSFGGVTALNAAHFWKPKNVVAHEPASDWMPDSARRVLFDPERLRGLSFGYEGGTGGFPENLVVDKDRHHILDDMNVLILFSEEWKIKQWSGAHVLDEMDKRGVFAKDGRPNRVFVLDQCTHPEFSDMCMLLPLWLARPAGLAGPRNPVEVAREIHHRSLDFLNIVKEKTA